MGERQACVPPYMTVFLPAPKGLTGEESEPPPASTQERTKTSYHTLERHPFWELVASAGESLHTPERISTFMTTDPLCSATNILSGGLLSRHLVLISVCSEDPASPALLTSKGPHEAQVKSKEG